MRNNFIATLADAAADNPKIWLLAGDLGYSVLEPFAARFPNRYLNMGVAEQNMVSVAAGLARTGLKPWVYSIAPFLYARPYEQIRTQPDEQLLLLRHSGWDWTDQALAADGAQARVLGHAFDGDLALVRFY